MSKTRTGLGTLLLGAVIDDDPVISQNEAKVYEEYGLKPNRYNSHRLAMTIAKEFHPKFKNKAKRGAKKKVSDISKNKFALLALYNKALNRQESIRWSYLQAARRCKNLGIDWSNKTCDSRYYEIIKKEKYLTLLHDYLNSHSSDEEENFNSLVDTIEYCYSQLYSKTITQEFDL